MIPHVSGDDDEAPSCDEDLLTRAEASAFLALGIRLKPATVAWIWSTAANRPPCCHVRSRPYYPRGLLRDWAKAQITEVRSWAPAAARSRGRA